MHSCEVAVAPPPPPPIQGTALLLELGKLIIEGRSSHLKKAAPTPRTPESRSNTTASYKRPTASFNNNQEVQNGGGHCGSSLDDVHSRVLAAKLLNVKNYQKGQFKKDGDGDKLQAASTRSVSPGRDAPGVYSQHRVLKGQAEALWKEQVPLCIEVLLAPSCGACLGPLMLLERWTMSIYCKGSNPPNHITSQWLLNAVRSQLHFSQISAWSAKLHEEHKVVKEESPTERQRKLSRETCNFKKYESNCDEEELLKQEDKEKKKKLNVVYNIKIPGDDYRIVDFRSEPVKHTFPITDIGSNVFLMVLLESLPRLEEIPIVQCICSSNSSGTLKRRRSKDVVHASDEVLAHTLANVCSLNENRGNNSKLHHKEGETNLADDLKRRLKANALCSELGAINPDKGCSSGISRKLSVYSNPSNSDMLYSTPASRGSTPDNSEYKVSSHPCTSASCTDNSLNYVCHKTVKNIDCSYQPHVEDDKVPLETNFLLVDDRMQTPCGKKGKHRCNCDDESDHGSHLKDSGLLPYGDARQSDGCGSRLLQTCKSLDERRTKEIAKYLRRLRKEAKFKQMRDSGQSSQEDSECKSDETPKEKYKSASKATRSRHNDLNNKERGAMYSNVFRDEELQEELYHKYMSTQRNPVSEAQTSSHDFNSNLRVHKLMVGNVKSPESLPATSIPILQASRFDHAMRFGSYRTSVPFHGSLSSKDIYSPKELECACSSVGCDQMASVKTCKQSNSNQITDNNFNINTQDLDTKSTCRTFPTWCDFCNSDDNYRPVVKKMISSCTQTDDFKCDCGKSLVPKCFECSNNVGTQMESDTYHSGMKRSWGSHDLAGVDKSALLLEAIERPSRVSLESQKEDADTGIDAIIYCDSDRHDNATKQDKCSNNVQVIENKCDNSYSDKSKLYISCNSSDTDCLSAENRVSYSESVQHCNTTTSQPEKTLFVKFPFTDNFDKAINFIRSPRLRRFMPIVGKLDKIVMERNEEKKKDSFNTTSSSSNPISDSLHFRKDFYPNNDASVVHQEFDQTESYTDTTDNSSSRDGGNHIVVYEKGSYGSIIGGCMETKHGEKHSFDENEKSCKHFRSDNESHLTASGIEKVSCTDQCDDNDIHKNVKTSSLNIHLDHSTVPSVSEMDKFRWRLDSAASMVFHSGTGLPLTSSPAPLRRGKSSFDYDSSINSVSSIKSALYGASISDLESEPCNSSWSPGSSPGSPLHWEPPSPPLLTDSLSLTTATVEKDSFTYVPAPYSNIVTVTPRPFSSKRNMFRHGTSSGLLGSFEESVLNGRLEPAATVAGFTAEIGASGSFCPQHLKLPVTVFFYSLGDNTTSAPYLGHINLGRRGYNVPRAGTIQVTLFNPHGTVVKMFVVMYDMADMPPNSKTFLRQKTLCVPAVCSVQPSKQDPRALRYLINLRFLASKSGKVYLHTDIRIIVSRKADMDTAHSLKPAITLNDKEDRKKKSVETGTFNRRIRKDLKKPLHISINDNVFTTLQEKTTNQAVNFLLSSFPDKYEDLERGLDSDLMGDTKDGRIRRRSDSMDGLPKELSYELRSYTYGPDNPKYSPR